MLLLTTLSESDTKSWLETFEIVLLVATLVLVLGLVGEWSDSESWKRGGLYKLAKLLVLVGVMGELIGDAGIFETSGRLDQLREAENIQLQTIANEARDRAARSELTLEKFRAPRMLFADQQVRLAQKLAPFAGQRFQMMTYPGCEECSNLFKSILVTVVGDVARWERSGSPMGIILGAMSGIIIRVHDQASPQARLASQALVAGLNAEEIKATLESRSGRVDPTDADSIDIDIGLKP